ncbi:hypothetical protein COY52_00560 [Candidatus Desantisbacteria bacterium CG_4_10_14_0_8_um_filter_48_22]|uniref:Sn-glycerol-1-phosphate dehydrogenase n=1 Tax=Candidatus Desantisbacteria bacterium CG_4_10_14_0_8_um_filter_48_22 TaxID=1974543 RepID=A0A2M7SFZ6_9BACT|nr:MAG: hypothetical protein AUJ67_03965 [Candidatus Desantisbacteria bacterium CG1_02_49_89]PIV57284.1 MAG: hypothetical protein COS16_01105 [Candidatus Desantisbacteria bacterium CG02_land_8_20_14_3_00_49_13]PIZ18213.1 MAG: hypothetical protein COY52_00560 [Candidatus Desantisbacteria bacterium CG_4_10_14_0_8_um_filter_48_22]
MKDTLKELLGKEWKCGCGRTHRVPTKEIYCGANAKERLLRFIFAEMPGPDVAVVADTNTFAVAGQAVGECLAENGLNVKVRLFPAGRKKLKAEKELAEKLGSELKDFHFAVACGSGTINDLVKYAATIAKIPYISYPTAPSMNGYPSPIAALSYKGTKKTLAAIPPAAVIADLDILRNAPEDMIQAGIGDGISKSVCNIDWAVSRFIKKEYFCPLPGKMMAGVMGFYTGNAKKAAGRDPAAIKGLFEALNLAGVSMVIAGSSAPASGGEHLISHFLDMSNSSKGKDMNLHGRQVGVTTVLSAKLYEKLLKLDTDLRRLPQLKKHYAGDRQTKKEFMSRYGKKMAGEVYREFMTKYLPPDKKEKELLFILKNWGKIKDMIRKNLVPSKVLEKTLRRSGAPVSFTKLAITRAVFRSAILHAREIRGRYTVLDLAYDVDILESFANDVV